MWHSKQTAHWSSGTNSNPKYFSFHFSIKSSTLTKEQDKFLDSGNICRRSNAFLKIKMRIYLIWVRPTIWEMHQTDELCSLPWLQSFIIFCFPAAASPIPGFLLWDLWHGDSRVWQTPTVETERHQEEGKSLLNAAWCMFELIVNMQYKLSSDYPLCLFLCRLCLLSSTICCFPVCFCRL